MSRTVDSKSHLRNRSSTTRFGGQDSASIAFHPQKPQLGEVSAADRGKLQSFKFPSPTSSSRSSNATSDSFAIIGLPTPPPDLQFFPDHGSAMPSTEVMKGTSSPSAQYEIRTSCEVAADLVPMEGYVEETYEEYGRDSESSWSPYRWPLKSDSSHEAGPMKSPYGGHFVTPSAGASHYINTYRIKRGVIFRRGLPSALVVRALLIGSWLAMLVLIVLAILFIVKL